MGVLPESSLDGHENLRGKILGAFEMLQESRGVDFKGPIRWDDIKNDIVKDILAMGNTRDGGIIILGVGEADSSWEISGLSDEQVESYDPDDMIAHVNKYASPPMEFSVVKHVDEKNRNFVVIHVPEFSEIPFVCKKNSNGVREGAIYVRPLGKAESREVQNAEEMRDLLDVGIDKSVRNYLGRLGRIGIIVPQGVQDERSQLDVDQQKYDEEMEGL